MFAGTVGYAVEQGPGRRGPAQRRYSPPQDGEQEGLRREDAARGPEE